MLVGPVAGTTSFAYDGGIIDTHTPRGIRRCPDVPVRRIAASSRSQAGDNTSAYWPRVGNPRAQQRQPASTCPHHWARATLQCSPSSLPAMLASSADSRRPPAVQLYRAGGLGCQLDRVRSRMPLSRQQAVAGSASAMVLRRHLSGSPGPTGDAVLVTILTAL